MHLLRAVGLRFLPEILERSGIDPIGPFAGGLMPGAPAAEFMPLRPVLALLNRAATGSGDPAVCVRLAEAGGLAALGELGRFVRSAATVAEAIHRAAAEIGWWMPGARLRLGRDGTHLVWQAELPPGLGAEGRVAKPWLLAILRIILRAAAGPAWRPVALICEQGGRLEAAFRQPVIEDRIVTAVVFPGSLTRLAMPLTAGSGKDIAASLAATRPPPDFAGSLRILIRSLLPEACADASEVASLAGISLRGLQRSLAASGLSFSELLRDARLERAIELMREPERRMTDIGLELGYSDAANFTRAFRRWTGSSPRAYRRRLLEGRA